MLDAKVGLPFEAIARFCLKEFSVSLKIFICGCTEFSMFMDRFCSAFVSTLDKILYASSCKHKIIFVKNQNNVFLSYQFCQFV